MRQEDLVFALLLTAAAECSHSYVLWWLERCCYFSLFVPFSLGDSAEVWT